VIYADELEFARACAMRAGERIRRGTRDRYRVDIKPDQTPVTTIDRDVNAEFIEQVAARFPDDGVLGEEASRDGRGPRTWVVDPIDGTQQLILAIPVFMVSIALVEDGRPVVGVAYNPSTAECYWAASGGGAYREGLPIRVSTRDGELEPNTISGEGADANPSELTSDTLLRVRFVPRLEASPYRFPWPTVFSGCKVAEGSWDGDLYGRSAAYDVAALCVLVGEAGGKVTDRFGAEQRYDRPVEGCVVSNGLIHDELVQHWGLRSPARS
jgi:fructose-1,6-bisphosphatase/inositol monophosphatase family enzyme